MNDPFSLVALTRLCDAQTRSISAENPDGRKGGGAQAMPPRGRRKGSDAWCSDAASELGKGWKVRPCARNLEPGQILTLADIKGPGIIQHIWCTVLMDVHRWIALRVYYDNQKQPSIVCPLGDFFANGLDGLALINSLPIAVNPKGGMNSYWPMPFRKRIRIEITNDGPRTINEVFYQVTYALQEVPDDAAYLHASWRRSMTTRQSPEHVILDGVRGRGHYVGTYLAWNQLSNDWWGEGEVKFFIDGDKPGSPTICGTGTEDYFGGAWGFVMDHARDLSPQTYSTPFLGYPQALYAPSSRSEMRMRPRVPAHGLYRWHIPDPIRFQRDVRVTVQALGWWPTGKFQPLTDDIASVAYWYQSLPSRPLAKLPPINDRLAR
jgi:D-arabinan exo alpha-(1,3)/(1,5)-arabinofuranosidase (non-reducing end)